MQSLPVRQAQMLRTQFRVWLSLFPPKMVANSKEIHMQGQGEGPSTLSRDLCSGLVPSWGDRRSRALSLRLLRGLLQQLDPGQAPSLLFSGRGQIIFPVDQWSQSSRGPGDPRPRWPLLHPWLHGPLALALPMPLANSLGRGSQTLGSWERTLKIYCVLGLMLHNQY